MIRETNLRILPQEAYNEQSIMAYLQQNEGIEAQAIRVLKRSIDARQRTIYVNLTVRIYIDEEPEELLNTPIEYHDMSDAPEVIVVGAGPGGLFAALRLIELGLRPIIIERGKDVHERKKDLARIRPEQRVDPESNYSFGEGGAGAYSDGKLYTRSKKRGNSDRILNIFVQHGASPNILVDAHPHIGTDRLPRVIENMRNTILKCGGEVHFQTKMTGLIIKNNKVVGVEAINSQLSTLNSQLFYGPVILATGHSARDVYHWFSDNNIEIEAKGLAVGVRLEHPSALIDQIQYHRKEGRGKYLPAAEYSFVHQVDNRGVYSFCMCPGGFVVPAASGPEQLVVNGMSPSNRGSKWSNSGMVVELHPEDLGETSIRSMIEDYVKVNPSDEAEQVVSSLDNLPKSINPHNSGDSIVAHPLSVLLFQDALERQSWIAGNMKQTAPAQRMSDFVNRRLSVDLPSSSYVAGLIASPLHFWMPKFITERLKLGFLQFGKM